MIKHAIVACALFFSTSLFAPAQDAKADSGGTLEVHLTYTGSGTVDSAHPVYIACWDSPKFTTDSSIMPIAASKITSKDGTVTFPDVKANPAYVSAAYDPTGAWDAQGPPPAGTIVGMYGTGGKPTPIAVKPGKTATVKMTLDDSIKLPPRQ